MSNRDIAAMVCELKLAVGGRNPSLASQLDRAMIDLLERTRHIEVTGPTLKEDLMTVRGINIGNVDYVMRVCMGERVNEVVESVPMKRTSRTRYVESYRTDKGEWSGSWDNVVGAYERD